jgi:hypothetical protein
MLLLDVSTVHHRDLSYTWTCWTTGACAAPGRVYTTGSRLHLDVYGQQDPLLLSDVSTLQGPELHLDVPRLQEPLLPWTCLPFKGLF